MENENLDSEQKKIHYFLLILRIALGLIFLWAFFDKLLGLGFATCFDSEINKIVFNCDSAWINGGSPTSGFLKFATSGPLSPFYQSLADSVFVDWLFMAGLLGIGLTLTLGFLVRIGSLSGSVLIILMWSSRLPPENNPLIDEHIIYAIILLGFAFIQKNKNWWNKLGFVRRYWVLE